MNRLREALKKYALKDNDLVSPFNAREKDFFKNMDNDKFEMWIKQLGVEKGSNEYDEIKAMVDKLRIGKI